MRNLVGNLIANIFGSQDAASRVARIVNRGELRPDEIYELGEIASFSDHVEDSKLALTALADIYGEHAQLANAEIRRANTHDDDIGEYSIGLLEKRLATDPPGIVNSIGRIAKQSFHTDDKLAGMNALARIKENGAMTVIGEIARDEEGLAPQALELLAASDKYEAIRATSNIGREIPEVAVVALENVLTMRKKFNEAASPDMALIDDLAMLMVEELMQTELLFARIKAANEDERRDLRAVLARAAALPGLNNLVVLYDQAEKVADQTQEFEKIRLEAFPK